MSVCLRDSLFTPTGFSPSSVDSKFRLPATPVRNKYNLRPLASTNYLYSSFDFHQLHYCYFFSWKWVEASIDGSSFWSFHGSSGSFHGFNGNLYLGIYFHLLLSTPFHHLPFASSTKSPCTCISFHELSYDRSRV